MGKKKNKRYDIWDLTPEEQNQQMDDMYAIESGCGGILSLARIDNSINENGLSLGLEKEIAKDLLGKRDTVVNLDGDEVSDYNLENSVTQMEQLLGVKPTVKKEKKKNKSREIDVDMSTSGSFKPVPKICSVYCEEERYEENKPSKYNGLRFIRFELIKELNRLIIDDGGIAPTSYSFDIGVNQDIVAPYDADQAGELCYFMMLYITTLKHPTAIYEYYEFSYKDKWKFVMVDNEQYDHNKFIFFRAGNYILAYLIDDESVSEFHKFMDEMEYDVHDILKTFISMCYAVGTLNQAFFVEDEEYVKSFMKSEYNKQNEFHDLFINDKSTKLIEDIEGLDASGAENFILDDIQYYVRKQLSRLTGSSYFDEDEDDDDDYEDEEDDQIDESDSDDEEIDDDNCDDEDETDEEDEDDNEDGEDYSDLLSADMEEVNDSDSLIIPVIRKK